MLATKIASNLDTLIWQLYMLALGDKSYLSSALLYLERVMEKKAKESPIVLKLLAIRLNALLGHFEKAVKIFKGMEIKNIQLESALYLIGDCIGFLPNHFNHFCNGLFNLYESNSKEVRKKENFLSELGRSQMLF